MPAPFGPCTLVIEWKAEAIDQVQRAIAAGCPALAGVRLMTLYESDDAAKASSAWGGVWVAATLPPAMFAQAMEAWLRDGGALDVAHAVHPLLLGPALDFLEDREGQ